VAAAGPGKGGLARTSVVVVVLVTVLVTILVTIVAGGPVTGVVEFTEPAAEVVLEIVVVEIIDRVVTEIVFVHVVRFVVEVLVVVGREHAVPIFDLDRAVAHEADAVVVPQIFEDFEVSVGLAALFATDDLTHGWRDSGLEAEGERDEPAMDSVQSKILTEESGPVKSTPVDFRRFSRGIGMR
jgi:hypothetical protein